MQKKKGNMYAFITHTYNPIKGLCTHKCSYCYMNPIYQRFKQNPNFRLDTKELGANLGKGNYIFLGSSTDMFADVVPIEWITKVYDHCLDYNENKFLFQSKNPSRFLLPELIGHPLMERKESIRFATTIETNREEPKVSDAPSMRERIEAMTLLSQMGYKVMITMEPIMDFDLNEVLDMMSKIRPFQVNIGFNSRKSISLPEPSREKTMNLILALKQETKVEIKSNSNRVLGEGTDMVFNSKLTNTNNQTS